MLAQFQSRLPVPRLPFSWLQTEQLSDRGTRSSGDKTTCLLKGSHPSHVAPMGLGGILSQSQDQWPLKVNAVLIPLGGMLLLGLRPLAEFAPGWCVLGLPWVLSARWISFGPQHSSLYPRHWKKLKHPRSWLGTVYFIDGT